MQLTRSADLSLRRVPVWVIWVAGLLPLAWMLWLGFTGGLGVDPVKELEHRLGKVGLQFILLGLAVTPLRRFLGVNLMRFRRAIGLLAFTYVALHLLVWLTLDIQLRWAEIGADLLRRPYVIIGMIGFLLLLPLALTSNNYSIRKLGPMRWRMLHRLTYGAAVAGGIHYVILVKGWPIEPFLYLGGIIALLALRIRPAPGR